MIFFSPKNIENKSYVCIFFKQLHTGLILLIMAQGEMGNIVYW